MTLIVDPAERAHPQVHLAVGEESHPRKPPPEQQGPDRRAAPSDFDATAPVLVDPETEAAVADLHVIDAVSLAIALARYAEDG